VLGFLLFGVVLATVIFILWEATDVLLFKWPMPPPKFETHSWVVGGAAAAAVIGWIVSAMTTIRNSVKQHTINTLLQSRLSATYMAHAEAVGDHFAKFIAAKRNDPEGKVTVVDDMPKKAIGYILNYYEFIALGIRHGDLDEGVLKSSLRSMVGRTVYLVDPLIKDAVAENPRAYCHLIWLYGRWRDQNLEKTPTNLSLPVVLTADQITEVTADDSDTPPADRS
jgi:hypothetical protein